MVKKFITTILSSVLFFFSFSYSFNIDFDKILSSFSTSNETIKLSKNQIKIRNQIIKSINNINFDNAVKDVCLYEILVYNDKNACKILNKYYQILKLNYKTILYGIAYRESRFKYKVGLYDKNDISYYQINVKQFPLEKLKILYPIYYTKGKYKNKLVFDWTYKHLLLNNIQVATNVAIRVYLVNFISYMKYKKYKLSTIGHFANIYHQPYKVNKNYVKTVNYFIRHSKIK